MNKQGEGGVCFLVNEAWCTDSKVLSQTCTPELETLTIHCRPFYLPKEFGSLILTVTYIPPEASTTEAMYQLSDIIFKHEKAHPGQSRSLPEIAISRLYGKRYQSFISTWYAIPERIEHWIIVTRPAEGPTARYVPS